MGTVEPLRVAACRGCGWEWPKAIDVSVRVGHVREVGGAPPRVVVGFDCPRGCARFEASFAPGAVTIEQG